LERRFYKSGALYAELGGEEQRYFYEDGTLKSLIPYEDDRLHGEVRLYHSDGSLKRLITYVHGERLGLEKWIDRDGTLRLEVEHYKEGISGRYWDEQGELKAYSPTE
jgi:antitoxin component YwqK of YwqJK toxin-antitoxin module